MLVAATGIGLNGRDISFRRYIMNSMFCIRCYLNVIALYTALQLDVMIEQFRLTQMKEFYLQTSF